MPSTASLHQRLGFGTARIEREALEAKVQAQGQMICLHANNDTNRWYVWERILSEA